MPNMNQNHLAAILFRWSIIAMFALCASDPSAPAQPVQTVKPTTIDGVYNGSYAGDQGPIKFKLTIAQQGNGALAGTCTLYLPDGANTNEYTCDVRGRYIAVNRMVQVIRGKWETAPPAGIDMLGMNGVFDPDANNGAGQISGKMRARPAPQFEAIRDADASAKLADANAAKNHAAAPATPIARPERRPTAANRPAPAPSTPAPPSSPAPDVNSPTAINGVYTGGYTCVGTGVMKAKLTLKSTDDGALTGLFTFDLPESSGSGSATYKLTGKYVAGNRWPFQFTTAEPLGKPAPDIFAIKTLSACFAQGALVQGANGMEYSLNPDRISGSVSGGTHSVGFAAVRDKAASADLDKAMAAQANAGATNAPTAPAARPAFEGVYNGTYAAKEGPVKFKLTLWMKMENRTLDGTLANTNIAGLLTLNLPDGSDTKAYTAELAGFFVPNGNLQLTTKRWESPPPSKVAGLNGKFDPDAAQISGYISDPDNSKFQAIRDAAESANLDSARLRKNIKPGIPGVFNGTYTRENEPPARMKLTITRTQDGLGGVASIYLSTDSGTKAYAYSLKGAVDGPNKFHLFVNDWETPPPKDFKNFKAMGFNGTLVLDLANNAARIVSAPAPASLATFYVPQFEATWDATESTDIPATIAAQKAVGAEDQAAALKAYEEAIKHAAPKQLASNNLVRKSRAYWQDYQTDMLREVFDGGFGADIDQDLLFEELFCSYVDMFSAKCPGDLPPKHESVTVTRYRARRNATGGYDSVPEQSWTVEVDSRFAPKYREFVHLLGSSGQGLRTALAAMSSNLSPREIADQMLAPARDMDRFFANHAPRSAAMRQLTENFLRGATGQLSLQQAGEKIDGAQAESDKDLPPGRFARFVDGANAFYRDPANARYSSKNDTAFCQGMAMRYQFKMSPAEEYYYANDFENRFYRQIMQPRQYCTDPKWPVLHPVVEECVAKYR